MYRRPARLPEERQASRLPLRSGRVSGRQKVRIFPKRTGFFEEDRFLRRGQVSSKRTGFFEEDRFFGGVAIARMVRSWVGGEWRAD